MTFGIRVGVKGGGCSGPDVHPQRRKRGRAHEKVIDDNGVKVFVDKKSYTFWRVRSLTSPMAQRERVRVSEPHAKKSCGCGNSFSV